MKMSLSTWGWVTKSTILVFRQRQWKDQISDAELGLTIWSGHGRRKPTVISYDKMAVAVWVPLRVAVEVHYPD